jgi:hypothetical protein
MFVLTIGVEDKSRKLRERSWSGMSGENMQLSRLAGLERACRSCFGRCYGEMMTVLGLALFSLAAAPGALRR